MIYINVNIQQKILNKYKLNFFNKTVNLVYKNFIQ